MTQRTPDEKNEGLPSGALYCGAHYSKCPVEIRELWAQGFALPEGPAALQDVVLQVMGNSGVELVPISTCNRFDLCLFGNLQPEKVGEIFLRFAQWSMQRLGHLNPQKTVSEHWTSGLQTWLRAEQGERALEQLFRVGASLDSLVLGEPHILGQLKQAYSMALERGHCGNEATSAFNRAFQIAKRVRTETELGKNAVSVGHAAVAIVQRVFENLNKQRCLIMGAGEMARIAAQHLRACGAEKITIANRTLERAQELSEQLTKCSALPLNDSLLQLHEFDVIITATASQDFVLKKEHSAQLLRRRSGLPCVIVDISVPRNVDPSLGALENLFVFDIDDLDKVMESGRKARRAASLAAETIIQEELAEFISHRRQRENLVNVGKFHALVRTIVSKEIAKSLRNSKSLDDPQIEITADAIAKKLVAHPAMLARSDVRADGEKNSVGDMLQLLFKLPPEKEN